MSICRRFNQKHNVGQFLLKRFADLVTVSYLHIISRNHSIKQSLIFCSEFPDIPDITGRKIRGRRRRRRRRTHVISKRHVFHANAIIQYVSISLNVFITLAFSLPTFSVPLCWYILVSCWGCGQLLRSSKVSFISPDDCCTRFNIYYFKLYLF